MGVNFSVSVLLPNFDFWARPIMVTPLRSMPGQAAYAARAIWDSDAIDYLADGNVVVSDQKTFVDVRDAEFRELGLAVPRQGDVIDVPNDEDVPAEGTFEVIDAASNGGGETTLTVRRLDPPLP